MGELKERIYASRDRYYADKNSGNYEFTDDVCDFIESEFDRFISYVDDYSDMQEKIDEGRANIENIDKKSIIKLLHYLIFLFKEAR